MARLRSWRCRSSTRHRRSRTRLGASARREARRQWLMPRLTARAIVTMPARDEQHLPRAADAAAVQIGNQVGHRDVEEVAGGKGEHVGQPLRHDASTASTIAAAPRMPPVPASMFSVKRAHPRIAGAQQDRDVAHFLRNLVRRDRERRGQRRAASTSAPRPRSPRRRRRCGTRRRRSPATPRAVCTWQSSSSWQCRQITAFSSRKNARMPTTIVSIAGARRQLGECFGHERQQRHADQRPDRIADQPRHAAACASSRRAAETTRRR